MRRSLFWIPRTWSISLALGMLCILTISPWCPQKRSRLGFGTAGMDRTGRIGASFHVQLDPIPATPRFQGMSSTLREITREEVAKVNVYSTFNQPILTGFSQHHTAGDLVSLVTLANEASSKFKHSGLSLTPSSMTCRNSTSCTRAE